MREQRGFTLIELLVVVAIIGILAAIAVPQFAEYRERAFDADSLSDLRNAATAEELYYVDNETYVDCIGAAACEGTLPGFRGSDGVSLSMFWVSDAPATFSGSAFHPKGTRHDLLTAFMWNSANGGLQ